MINEKTLNKLEYFNILNAVSAYAESSLAKSQLMQVRPHTNIEFVNRQINFTNEAMCLLNLGINPVRSVPDCLDILERAEVKSTLLPNQIIKVGALLRATRLTKSAIESATKVDVPQIFEFACNIMTDRVFEERIEKVFVNEDELSDHASPTLASLRKRKRKINDEIRERLSGYIKNESMQRYLQDSIITIRNDRFVIPVKQEYKGSVGGLIHDQSASGATVFIEPMQILDLNNQLKSCLLEEQAEIERILSELTAQISTKAEQLRINTKCAVELDVVFAKALYASETKSFFPKINTAGKINLIKARHPLLNKDKVVPVSLHLGNDFNILIISGPNTGGKSVALKTVGLFCLMVMSGMMIPANENSEISVFENIYCDIGDEQSIENSLSTFSSHMTNISQIVSQIKTNSLVLLDELGSGTDPSEGAALAKAIIDHILLSGAKAVITTHYGELKEYALTNSNTMGVASMEFNAQTLEPTYNLRMGFVGASNAIEISAKLGLDSKIIEKAKGHLSEEKVNFEKLLLRTEAIRQKAEADSARINEAKQQIEQELFSIKQQQKQLEETKQAMMQKSKVQAQRIVSEAEQQAEEMIDELKKMIAKQNLTEQELFKARQIKKNLQHQLDQDDFVDTAKPSGVPVDAASVSVGQTVYVNKLNRVCEIASLPDRKGALEILVGSVKMKVNLSDLSQLEADGSVRRQNKPVLANIDNSSRNASTEIKLLGKTVSEAIYDVDLFIDNACICGFNEIRVVHGMGTGALRKGLHEHFKHHPSVHKFRLGQYGEGGAGVTILTLKD